MTLCNGTCSTFFGNLWKSEANHRHEHVKRYHAKRFKHPTVHHLYVNVQSDFIHKELLESVAIGSLPLTIWAHSGLRSWYIISTNILKL